MRRLIIAAIVFLLVALGAYTPNQALAQEDIVVYPPMAPCTDGFTFWYEGDEAVASYLACDIYGVAQFDVAPTCPDYMVFSSPMWGCVIPTDIGIDVPEDAGHDSGTMYPDATAQPSDNLEPDEWAWVSSDGAECLDAPYGSRIAWLGNGTEVGVIYDDDKDGWQKVVVWDQICFILSKQIDYQFPEAVIDPEPQTVPEPMEPTLENPTSESASTAEPNDTTQSASSATGIIGLPSTGSGPIARPSGAKEIIGAIIAAILLALFVPFYFAAAVTPAAIDEMERRGVSLPEDFVHHDYDVVQRENERPF